jgi:hypothetical protein
LISDAVWIAAITAIAPIISVVVSHILSSRKFKRADDKLDHITILTNSTLTAANKRIGILEDELAKLHEERLATNEQTVAETTDETAGAGDNT